MLFNYRFSHHYVISAHEKLSEVVNNQSMMASIVDSEFLRMWNETSALWWEADRIYDDIGNLTRMVGRVDRKAHDLNDRVVKLVERVNAVELRLDVQLAEAEGFRDTFAQHRGLVIAVFIAMFALQAGMLYVSSTGKTCARS